MVDRTGNEMPVGKTSKAKRKKKRITLGGKEEVVAVGVAMEAVSKELPRWRRRRRWKPLGIRRGKKRHDA